MMNVLRFLVPVLLIGTAFSVQAQSPDFFAQIRVIGTNAKPYLLEKMLNSRAEIKQSDTCITMNYGRFVTFPEYIDTFSLRVCRAAAEIRIDRNNTPRHRLPITAKAEGLLFGRKVNVFFKEVFDSLNKVRYLVWEEEGKPSNSVVFRDQIPVPIYESQGIEQRRALEGEVFEKLIQPGALDSVSLCSAEKLRNNDRIQFLIETRKTPADAWSPAFVLDHQLHRRDTLDGYPRLHLSNRMTNLANGTIENRDTVTMQIMPEGIFLGNFIGMPYSAFKPMLKVSDPKDERWVYYMFPMEELYDPIVEASYRSQSTIGNRKFECLSYWNSTFPGPFTWIHDFPLPWRNTELIRQVPIFMQLNAETFGTPYTMPENTAETQLQLFNETAKGIDMQFIHKGKKKLRLQFEITNAALEVQPLSQKEFSIKPGETSINLPFSNKNAEQYYLLKVFIVEGKNQFTLLQEMPFVSKKNP